MQPLSKWATRQPPASRQDNNDAMSAACHEAKVPWADTRIRFAQRIEQHLQKVSAEICVFFVERAYRYALWPGVTRARTCGEGVRLRFVE